MDLGEQRTGAPGVLVATRRKTGSRDGIEWRTDTKGVTRYRWVLNLKTGKERGKWCGSHAEAKVGRVKAQGEAALGVRRSATTITLREAWEDFYAGAKAGTVMSRSRTPFKPATLRGYERAWKRIDPELGAHRLDSITRADLQAMLDRWARDGVKPATIRNSIEPLRTIYRRAMQRDLVRVNPTVNLDVPRVDNARERFASREEAAELLDALPDAERALWATAFYGGLRRGELRALRWTHVDLAAGLIRVQASWDDVEGEGPGKTKAANRKVPLVPYLLEALTAHKAATGRSGNDLVFGRTADEPFIPTTTRNRALAAWKRENERRTKAGEEGRLVPIGLHECRHTCASLLIAAGANAKALSVVLGHESITITFDRYGKLMPGGESEVGRLLGHYLESAASPR